MATVRITQRRTTSANHIAAIHKSQLTKPAFGPDKHHMEKHHPSTEAINQICFNCAEYLAR